VTAPTQLLCLFRGLSGKLDRPFHKTILPIIDHITG
jgi:hypothetical protein